MADVVSFIGVKKGGGDRQHSTCQNQSQQRWRQNQTTCHVGFSSLWLGFVYLFALISLLRIVNIHVVHDVINLSDIEGSGGWTRKAAAVAAKVATFTDYPEESHHIPTSNDDLGPLNIIIFYPDDWRHDDLGSVNPVVVTPFLDALASRGIRFAQNAVTTSICWISRATMFSGQYLSRHASSVLNIPRFAMPKAWQYSWPYVLQKHRDYFVGHVGKWQYNHVYDDYLKKEDIFNFSHFFEGNHEKNGRRNTDEIEKFAKKFLVTRPKDRPFALTLAYYPPKAVGQDTEPGSQWKMVREEIKATHYGNTTEIPPPYSDISMEEAFQIFPEEIRESELRLARGRWEQRWRSPEHYQEGMKNYYSLITEIDESCGRIYDMIVEMGIANNTLVIFTTDNGLFHGAHGLAGKWFPLEESIRVPLIIQDPRMDNNVRGLVDNESLVLNIDLAATILGAAGLDVATFGSRMQGRDISKEIYLGRNKSLETLKRDDWYYEFTTDHAAGATATAVVGKRYKYIKWLRVQFEQLFDLKEDPKELHDIGKSPKHQSVLEMMRVRHDELRAEVLKPCISDTPCDINSGLFNHSKFIELFHSGETLTQYEPL